MSLYSFLSITLGIAYRHILVHNVSLRGGRSLDFLCLLNNQKI